MDSETVLDATPNRDTGQTPTVAKLSLALAKAQGAMKPAVFDRENPGFHFKYATLASIWEAIRGPMAANELAVCQEPLAEDGRVGVITTLMHSSGEWKRSTLLLKPTRDDPQGVGSALTYARRYSLAAMTGAVAEEDDDGNAASQAKVAPPANTKESVPKPITMDEVPHVCGIHKVDFKRYSKPDGEVWYSHKLPDGKWCNEGKAEADKKPKEPAPAPESAPGASQDAPKKNLGPVIEADFLAMSDIDQANLLIEAVKEFGRDKWAALRQEIGLPVKTAIDLTAEQRLAALKAIVGAKEV